MKLLIMQLSPTSYGIYIKNMCLCLEGKSIITPDCTINRKTVLLSGEVELVEICVEAKYYRTPMLNITKVNGKFHLFQILVCGELHTPVFIP
jgi:hypothetical protein